MTTPPSQIVTPRVHRTLVRRVIGRWRFLRFRMFKARTYASCGQGSMVDRPFLVTGAERISLGAGVFIWPMARIEALAGDGSGQIIEIGDGTSIQPFVHLAAVASLRIGRDCLFASHVYITDHDHDWRDGDVPARLQPQLLADPVFLGDGVWLGERVCVLKGVTIGDGAIVGAGSVVTKDIPPRCIAVGAPARVVKRWNDETKQWENAR
jgi:lipopolysaccharide O-acetyltransferase